MTQHIQGSLQVWPGPFPGSAWGWGYVIKNAQWYTQNVCDRGLYEPCQSLLSVCMSNNTVNFAGKYPISLNHQADKSLKWTNHPSSDFFLSFCLYTFHWDSMTTAEAITNIPMQKNCINWTHHSLFQRMISVSFSSSWVGFWGFHTHMHLFKTILWF